MVSASGGQQSTLNIAFMLLLGMLLVSSALGDGNATQDAVVTVDNPMLAFEALMPDTLDVARGGIVGSVAAYGNENGVGITFEIQLDQFPDYDTYGPFSYHIHENHLDTAGNCETAGAHLDPYNRGADPPCDASNPQTCQVGDLSGKHGAINSSDDFWAKYTDLYAATLSTSAAYIGNNRSVVIHANDGTRLACANLTMMCQGSYNSDKGYNVTRNTCPRFQRTAFTQGTWISAGTEVAPAITVSETSSATESGLGNPIASAPPAVATVTVTETVTESYPILSGSLSYLPPAASTSNPMATTSPVGFAPSFGNRFKFPFNRFNPGSNIGVDKTTASDLAPTKTTTAYSLSSDDSVFAHVKRAAANSGEKFSPWAVCRVVLISWFSFLLVFLVV